VNTIRNHERLDKLAAEIDALRTRVIETERAALDLFGDDHDSARSSAEVIVARSLLQSAMLEYFSVAEFVRGAERPRKAA